MLHLCVDGTVLFAHSFCLGGPSASVQNGNEIQQMETSHVSDEADVSDVNSAAGATSKPPLWSCICGENRMDSVSLD